VTDDASQSAETSAETSQSVEAPLSAEERTLRRVRVAGLGVLGFLLMLSYALARPASEALFLQAHGKEALPYVWLAVAAGSTLVVWLYNRLVTRFGLLSLFASISLLSGLLFAVSILAVSADLPGSRYGLYLWKDLYIVALVEIFYSYSNSVFPIRTARWAYGFFGMLGSAGGAVGHLAVGRVAARWGSAAAIWLLTPLLTLLGAGAWVLGRRAGIGAPLSKESGTAMGSMTEAFAMVRRSAYLFQLLLLIGLVQVVVTLIDFDFNALVTASFAMVDTKTAAIGDVYAAISISTLVLHASTGPTLRLCGVPIVLLTIPVLLGASILGYALWPVFLLGAVMKIASKALDYTIFRAAKEILYIPLSYRERTQGKALVDMLTYRVAKGGASVAVLALVQLSATWAARWLSLSLIAVWLLLTVGITRRFRREISREVELASGS
jgi:AAA family ATP:ADP antiporter